MYNFISSFLFAYCALSSVVERFIDIEKAAGSIPAGRTNIKDLVKVFYISMYFLLGSNGKGVGKTVVFPWRKH